MCDEIFTSETFINWWTGNLEDNKGFVELHLQF